MLLPLIIWTYSATLYRMAVYSYISRWADLYWSRREAI